MSSHYFARLTWWQQLATLFGQRPEQKYNEPMPIEPQDEPLYTVQEAADKLGMSRQRVHQLIDDGRLKAQRHGKFKLIPQSELDALQERIKSTGRPRKS